MLCLEQCLFGAFECKHDEVAQQYIYGYGWYAHRNKLVKAGGSKENPLNCTKGRAKCLGLWNFATGCVEVEFVAIQFLIKYISSFVQ